MNPGARVLVVDDDPEILEMTALLLRGAGHDVTLASCGEEALLRAQTDPPDLVLLDLNMPGMDGWDVLRILREDDATAALPVVVFSVRFELREKLRALQLGAAEYVTKPFDTAALLRRVDTIRGAAARGTRP